MPLVKGPTKKVRMTVDRDEARLLRLMLDNITPMDVVRYCSDNIPLATKLHGLREKCRAAEVAATPNNGHVI